MNRPAGALWEVLQIQGSRMCGGYIFLCKDKAERILRRILVRSMPEEWKVSWRCHRRCTRLLVLRGVDDLDRGQNAQSCRRRLVGVTS